MRPAPTSRTPARKGRGFHLTKVEARTELRLTTTVSSNAGGGTDQTLAMSAISIAGRSAKSYPPWLAPELFLGDGVGAARVAGKLFR